MTMMNGAQCLIRLLERQGIRTIAGIPGGANLPMYDALGKSEKIRHVLARHEQGAGFIAQGMSRTGGKAAVCFATSGPGATNLLTAIADAKLDSTPIVCITGQVPSALIGSDAFQEVDTYGLSLPITKHNFLVRNAEELLEVVPEAFRIAASGRPGPVLIDVPKDVQLASMEINAWPEPGEATAPKPIAPKRIREAADLLNAAERPLLYIGGGAMSTACASQIRSLVESADMPATMTLMGLGVLPSDHPHSLGMLGMHGARYTNMALAECDLLFAVGARFDDRATGKVSGFCPTAKIIHIDIDPSEIDKIKTAHVGIESDLQQALEALMPLVKKQERTAWRARIGELKAAAPMIMPGKDDPRSPYGLLRQAASLVGPEAIVATDVGQHQMWTAQAWPFYSPRTFLSSGGLGTMGFGLPAAIGAALEQPDKPVVCVSGDGSIMMNIQELATAVEEKLNIKIILMNNQALGLVRQQQNLFYEERLYESNFRVAVDFAKIAEGFGMPCMDLAQEENWQEGLAQAFAQAGPCLIHAPIPAEEQVFPMVPPGGANHEMIGGENDAKICA